MFFLKKDTNNLPTFDFRISCNTPMLVADFPCHLCTLFRVSLLLVRNRKAIKGIGIAVKQD